MRTTLYLDGEVMAYLKLKNVPASKEARRFFDDLARSMGYEDSIEVQMEQHRMGLKKLKRIYNLQHEKERKRRAFLAVFYEYLSKGEPKHRYQIEGWLSAPGNQKLWAQFIGAPGDINPNSMDALIKDAMNAHRRKPLDDELRL